MKKVLFFTVLVVLAVANRVKGCATCGELNGGQDGEVGPSFSVSMGASQYGQSDGNLYFSSSIPDPNLFTPIALQYDASNRTDVVMVTTNVLTTNAIVTVETNAVLVTNYVTITNFITTVAGTNGFPTSLNVPNSIARDPGGNLYIANTLSSLIEKVDTNGIITVVAGGGSMSPANGESATNVILSYPSGVAVDTNGDVYIADAGNNLVEKVDTNGNITVMAGGGSNPPTSGGSATSVALSSPYGVAVDTNGNIYIADAGNNLVEKVDTNGNITVMAGGGSNPPTSGGSATSVALSSPSGVTLDTNGNIYIADTGNNFVEKVDTNGNITVMAGGGSNPPTSGGSATSVALSSPYGVAVDTNGNVYIADAGNNLVEKVDTNGNITVTAGNGTYGYSGDGGEATTAELDYPCGVYVGSPGSLYIADSYNSVIRKVAANGLITTLIGENGEGYSGDGNSATSANLNGPLGVAADSSGDLYIADSQNSVIRKVNSSGIITTVAGDGTAGYTGDGSAATNAELSYPFGIAVDASGDVYFVDSYENVVRKVNSSGIITTVAGDGTAGYTGDGGPAASAELKHPSGVAVDSSGNLYIADTGNNSVRMVNSTSGDISTVAGDGTGTAGYTGDGGVATSAELNSPLGVAVDSSGNLYIADTGNNSVRMVNSTNGDISTVAGDGTAGYTGDGGVATSANLTSPGDVVVDGSGDLYIADTANNVVRMVDTNGIIHTVAGNGLVGYLDDVVATNAILHGPSAIAVGVSDTLYIADTTNDVIRMMDPDGVLTNGWVYDYVDTTVTNVTLELTTNVVIRQVLAPQALADVLLPTSTNGYVINFYYPSQVGSQNPDGTYQVSGTPFITWAITNADPNGPYELQISEIGNVPDYGLMKQWTYNYSASTGIWSVQPLGGVYQENMSISNLSSTLYQVDDSFQTPSGPIVQQSKDTYKTFTWSQCTTVALETNVLGSDSDPEITAYTYWDPANFGAGSMVLPKTVTNPDGSWEYYAGYNTNGYPTNVYSSFEDVSLADYTSARQTTYDYTSNSVPGSGDDDALNPSEPRETVQYVNGQEVARSYTVFPSEYERLDIQCTVAGAGWNASGNLVTTNFFYSSGPNQFALEAVIQPDGTLTTYNYLTNDTCETNIVVTGQSDPTGTNYVVDGVSNVTVLNNAGYDVFAASYDVKTGIALSQDAYGNFDSYGRPQQVTHLDGTTEYTTYACCGLDSTINKDGLTTQYLYDPAKRQIGYQNNFSSGPIVYTNLLDAAGRNIATIRVGSDNSVIIQNQSAYDLAGELIAQTNALGGVTTYTRSDDPNTGGLIRTTTDPDGGIITNYYYADGSLKETSGTAVHGKAYAYGVGTDAGGDTCTYTVVTNLNTDGSLSSEWTKTFTDMAGRTAEILYADGSYSRSFFDIQGQLSKQIDPDGVVTLYQYDAKGELAYTATDMNRDGSINFNGTDRITQTTNDVTTDHGVNVTRTRTYVWQDGQSTGTLVSTLETTTSGLTNWQTVYRDANTPVTTESEITYSAPSRTVISLAPDNSYTINTYSYGRLVSSTRYDSTGAQIGGTTYTYDPHGRQYQTTDARNGATTYGYNNADLVTSVTTPNPGTIGGAPETTLTTYNNMLQAVTVTQPDNTSVTNIYLPTGELGETYGSRTYPVEYTYDYAGRMKTMTTWQNFANQTGAATTTWKYDGERGWLTNKVYADGTGPSYQYTSVGKLLKRTWVRTVGGQALATTYNYDNADDLTNVAYSDNTTPGVTNAYDRLGRTIIIAWSNITETLTYNLANQLLSESYSGGNLDGVSVTNGYDSDMRRTGLVALNGTTPLLQQNFGYDNASRLLTVSDGNNNSATYSYLANSPLVKQITFAQSGTTRMTTTKQYDYLNRLSAINNTPSVGSAVSFSYGYNSANQRIRDTLADGSYWLYKYDSLGQLTGANKYWNDEMPVAGQQFDYTFDTIGNRKQTKTDGDQNGWNQRVANYSVNDLNQYTSRDVPGYLDILGVSFATNMVTVNGNTAYRKGEYFWDEPPVDNSASTLWTNVTVTATGQGTVSGNKYVPQTPEQFKYDADGNLTNDGRWAYTWDAENRLTEMTVNTNVGPQYQLSFVYDPQGRRIEKVVSTNSGSAYVPVSTNKFLYDGLNLIAELGPNDSLIQSYVWGSDLSGSQQGASGVGGLLEVSYAGTNCFVAYDGNGNVAALVNAADGTDVANYEYGPFGELIRQTGPMAKANPFRFSTKYQDNESGLLYYGYRYYDPSTGRWANRDPMNERGGINLYITAGNNTVSKYDMFGLFPGYWSHPCKAGTILETIKSWAPLEFGPGDIPTGDLGEKFTDTINIVYIKTVKEVFVCPCSCRPEAYVVPRYFTRTGIGSQDIKGGHSGWGWAALPLPIDGPPTEVEEALISLGLEWGSDLAGDKLSPEYTGLVRTAERMYLPAPNVGGTLLKKDIPTKRCWHW